jgi:DNA-directed RNA polymerase subunit RPC12/RpoP
MPLYQKICLDCWTSVRAFSDHYADHEKTGCERCGSQNFEMKLIPTNGDTASANNRTPLGALLGGTIKKGFC